MLCQVPNREKYPRLSFTGFLQSLPRDQQVSLLHPGIIEVAQNILHSCEAVDYPVEITPVVQRPRCIDHVAQLVRFNPHLVYCLRGSLIMDRYRLIEQAAMKPQNMPRSHIKQRTPCVLRFGISCRCVLQKAPPTRQQISIAIAFEKWLQKALCVDLLTAEECEQSCQIIGREAIGHTPKAEHKHIQIPLDASGLCQPTKLGSEVSDCLLRKHILDLAKQRSRAPQRDPVVVQELGIQVGAHTGLVGNHDVEQSPVNLTCTVVCAHRPLQFDTDL